MRSGKTTRSGNFSRTAPRFSNFHGGSRYRRSGGGSGEIARSWGGINVPDVPNICQSMGRFWHLDSFNDLGMVAQIPKFSKWSAIPGSDIRVACFFGVYLQFLSQKMTDLLHSTR